MACCPCTLSGKLWENKHRLSHMQRGGTVFDNLHFSRACCSFAFNCGQTSAFRQSEPPLSKYFRPVLVLKSSVVQRLVLLRVPSRYLSIENTERGQQQEPKQTGNGEDRRAFVLQQVKTSIYILRSTRMTCPMWSCSFHMYVEVRFSFFFSSLPQSFEAHDGRSGQNCRYRGRNCCE